MAVATVNIDKIISDVSVILCTGWSKKVSHYQMIKNCIKSF